MYFSRNDFNLNNIIRSKSCLVLQCCTGLHVIDCRLCEICNVSETVPYFLFQCTKISTLQNRFYKNVENVGSKFNFKTVLSNISV